MNEECSEYSPQMRDIIGVGEFRAVEMCTQASYAQAP